MGSNAENPLSHNSNHSINHAQDHSVVRTKLAFIENITYSKPSQDIATYSTLKGTLCRLKKPKKCWKKARKAKLASTHTHALSTTSYPQSTYT